MIKFSRITAISLFLILIFLLSNCTVNNFESPATLENTGIIETPETKAEVPTETPEPVNPVEGWAVLASKDDYSDVGMTDLLVDYIDITRMRKALLDLGWKRSQIHELRGFDRDALETELDWLEVNADDNDIVVYYVNGHGVYLSDVVAWNDFFPEEWKQIPSQRRLLILDACTAEKFTDAVKDDSNPQFTIASVAEDELGWRGLEEEGLPIVGGVFTYYFTEALSSLDADGNGDGFVSVREAANYAEQKQRTYMHEVVLAIPQFLKDFHQIGYEPEKDFSYPDVILNDKISESFFLALEAYLP